MAICACNSGLGNTGRKKDLLKQSRGIILVQLVADSGTRNGIAVDDDVDEEYVLELINNPDKSQRWYPIQDLKNVEDTRAESVFETFNDGTRAKTRQGNRSFIGSAINQGSIFLGKLDSFECQKMGVYFVDDCHNLVGSLSDDGTVLYPVAIQDGSFDATLMKANDTATGRVQITFDISVLENDASLRVLEGLDFSAYEGLLDLTATISGISTTGFTATIVLDYEAFQEPLRQKGLVVGNFSLYNDTDAAPVVITSVTETSQSVYVFVMPAQTSGDILTLSLSKEGFEMPSVTINIP